MTTTLRDAAQALADIVMQQCGGYTSGPGFEAAEKARALTAALAAPQPAADERVAEHMRLVENLLGASYLQTAHQEGDGGYVAELAVEASARALLAAGREDAEHAAMYRWFRLNREVRATDGTMLHVYDEDGCILYGDELDAAIRAALQKGTP